MDTVEDKKKKLRAYFDGRGEVVMAFLFGSRAKGLERPQSDWDIAVYLKQENREVENTIWRDVERIVDSETDLVVLNRAPAVQASEILGRGEALVIKNRFQYLRLLFTMSEEADAFFRTAEEYYTTFARSASLSAPDREELLRILTFLEQEVKDYETFRALAWQEYADENNRMKKRAVERWTEQLVTAMLDAAKTIVASEKRKMPHTYREIVEELSSISPFNENNLAVKLAEWTRLRNILAHEYLDHRWKELSEFIAETEPLWKDFIEKVKAFMSKEGA